MDPAAVLWLALETLDVAQRAVHDAREAVETALAAAMAVPAVSARVET